MIQASNKAASQPEADQAANPQEARLSDDMPRITDAERAVLDAAHDALCACRQPSGLGLVIPHGGRDGALLAMSLMAQIERAGFRVVQADA